jgi:hypothetical protein
MTCNGCGITTYKIHGLNLCPACLRKDAGNLLNEYGYQPIPAFRQVHRETRLFMGVELEVASNDRDRTSFLIPSINKLSGGFIYCKHDGSLPVNHGVELVTHPATIRWHKQCAGWQSFLDWLKDYCYTNFQCGLHVHVNRSFFRTLRGYENAVLYDYEIALTELVAANKDAIGKIGGRPPSSPHCMHYANFNFTAHPKMARPRAVNLTNRHTVEFRFPASTLDWREFMSRLELIHALSAFTKHEKQNIITKQAESWDLFRSFVHKRRKLYSCLSDLV